MARVAEDRVLIDAIAAEMSAGIDCAVEFWMAQMEAVFEDGRMTTLGRLQAIKEILRNYRLAQNGRQPAGQGHAA